MMIQREVQRRQILSMMGVTPWVSREATCKNIQDILDANVQSRQNTKALTAETLQQNNPSPIAQGSANNEQSNSVSSVNPVANLGQYSAGARNQQSSPVVNSGSLTQPTSSETHGDYNSYEDHEIYATAYADEKTPVAKADHSARSVQGLSGNELNDTFNTDLEADFDDNLESESAVEVVVEPFTLQGLKYNGWVLLVDVASLSAQSLKLWQNMQVGLSTTIDQLSFPFCKSMSTLDMANASLAGFVFKLGGSEQLQVAALTELPEGLDHAQMVRTPLLEEMLAEPAQKKQLWQLLSA